jgi:hypothetical protein
MLGRLDDFVMDCGYECSEETNRTPLNRRNSSRSDHKPSPDAPSPAEILGVQSGPDADVIELDPRSGAPSFESLANGVRYRVLLQRHELCISRPQMNCP